ncbi:MAG: D-glycerate dehydrogenase [Deltaproteobacteria bacterium]|nr:D-glycerate dehydrogenase [Deltaproteobacteria bacterium]
MARVVISSALPIDVRPWLGDADVVAPSCGSLSRDALLAAVEDADALICLLTDRIDEELCARAPRLRIVANHAVGLDNVDVQACTRHGKLVTNTPGVLTEATADLTMALILSVARRVTEGDRLVRSGGWRGWDPGLLLGAAVSGQVLGIIGLGRIGRAVARRARGFEMRILCAGRSRAPEDLEQSLGATRVPLPQLLAESDFVSVHCPLTRETRGMLGEHELSLMKRTAFLINTARGACVDEDALARALEKGTIAGAGLDVFADEPRVPERLIAQPRAVLLPHVGSATSQARARMAELCATAVASVLRGERPVHLVNPEAWSSGDWR